MKKRVLVIGGGAAGLSAASSLLRMGCKVTLLEAKEKLGGRICTITDGNLIVELGAEFLHGESQTVTNAIKAAGLSTRHISEDYKIFEESRFKRVDLLKEINKIIHAVKTQESDCSFEEFIDAQTLNLTSRERAIGFVEGFHAAHPADISVHSLRRGEYAAEKMPSTKQGRINEGYGPLIEFLEREIREHGGKVHTSACVEKICWQPGRVEVAFRHADRQIFIEADAAVITLPLGVLKANAVEFQPALTGKREAIEQMRFGNVVKIAFEFRERWWPDFGFLVAADELFPTYGGLIRADQF